MAQKSAFPFGALLPGFEFMNQLASTGARSAGAPGLQHWIAPTVDVEELERRIKELKTVQFWLEQNLLGLKASIQALEVQKMTLQTLQGMNLSMGEIAKAFTLPTGAPASDAEKKDATPPTGHDKPATGRDGSTDSKKDPAGKAADAPATPLADPLQWWSALSQQFQQIATQALQDAAQALPPTPKTPSTKTPTSKAAAAPAAAKKTARKKPAAKTTARSGKASTPSARKTAPKK